jgi:lysozyme
MTILPPARPKLSEKEARAMLKRAGVTDAVAVLAIPGYYAKTMGPTPGNDRGIYDDAMFIVTPTAFAAFNANTDPSIFRHGIATLAPGVHRFRPGRHGISRDLPGKIVSYPAFRPATKGEALPVLRDGIPVNPRPGVATNIHRGGYNGTSSEGCQTLPPSQWDAFHALLTAELKRHGQKDFPYLLATMS